MKKRTIVAIGGYSETNGKDQPFQPISINQKIVELTGKKSPLVLFIPTASGDSDKYCKEFLAMFGDKLNCKTEILKLYSNDYDLSLISKADAIYVGGGNTLKMMTLWRRIGVDKHLMQAYQNGVVMSGVSAGSICWFKAGVSDSRQFKNPDSNQYIRVSGLGILPWLNNPHINSKLYDKGHRTAGMHKVLNRTGETCLAIEDSVAVVFENEEFIETIGGGKSFWVEG